MPPWERWELRPMLPWRRLHAGGHAGNEDVMARGATQYRAPRPSAESAYSAADQVLGILARYRAASIAVVAILLALYFEIRNSTYLTASEMSVILRDTG